MPGTCQSCDGRPCVIPEQVLLLHLAIMNDDARPEATPRRPTGPRKIPPPRPAGRIQGRLVMPVAQEPPTHEEIQELAYRLWKERGAPVGSPETDRERAERALRGDLAPSTIRSH